MVELASAMNFFRAIYFLSSKSILNVSKVLDTVLLIKLTPEELIMVFNDLKRTVLSGDLSLPEFVVKIKNMADHGYGGTDIIDGIKDHLDSQGQLERE